MKRYICLSCGALSNHGPDWRKCDLGMEHYHQDVHYWFPAKRYKRKRRQLLMKMAIWLCVLIQLVALAVAFAIAVGVLGWS